MSTNPTINEFDFLMRHSLMAFVEYTFAELFPQTPFSDSPHLAIIAAKLEECAAGKCKRLIICLPPRSLKSVMASVAFPAWVLGKYPHKQIICASYGQGLSDKHARDTRTIMTSAGYQRAFATRLSKQKLSVDDFMTTRGGFRMATSVGGVLTGRGGDILIIDDPMKPGDAFSETLRKSVNDWYDNTLLSRLNNKQYGIIIVVMQRLHQDDLVGHLLELDKWDVLRFPAIAEEDELHVAETEFGPIQFERKAGEVLDAQRETLETLRSLQKSMGDYAFQSQYQQNPTPEGGAIIKTDWLRYYAPEERPSRFVTVVQSWDTANKSGELNDYSVCTTWGVLDGRYYLIDVLQRRLDYPDLRRAVKEQSDKHSPHTVVIEDKGSGTQLLQDLRVDGVFRLKAYCPPPGNDKQMRLFAQSAVFENGCVWLPRTAPWLADYVRELTTFPGTKHDDQVDSTTQALDYMRNNNDLEIWARLGQLANQDRARRGGWI
jgi:predicted phage terminase large subunit-like protein